MTTPTLPARRSTCPSIVEADLPAIDYDHCASPAEAHAVIRAARRQGPIARGPHGPELLSYELVRSVLRDPRFRLPQGMFLEFQGITSGPLWDRFNSPSLATMTGPEHHRLRRIVSKAFTPAAAGRLRSTVVEVITGLVDRHAARGSCDVVTDIARPYPIPIICALLGAPAEDWEMFSQWTDDIFRMFSWNIAEHESVIVNAFESLDAYIDDMVAARRHTLTDDLISELIRAEDGGDRLSGAELRQLAGTLLIAGTDSTRHQLAASVHALCESPEQWALLGRHPELAMKAVEETVRHSLVSFCTPRQAVEDVEIGGVLVPAGTLILANKAAANRDPAVYDDPDRLDITRSAAAPMLSFGVGAHYCLGANLARVELAEALTLMARRMPGARCVGPVRWKPLGPPLSGPTTVPIDFDV